MQTSTNCCLHFFISLSILIFAFINVRGASTGYECELKYGSPLAKNTNDKMQPLTTEQLRQAEATIGDPESDQYDEEKFCEVLRMAVTSPLLNEADRMRAAYRLEIADKNRPGTIASDFTFETRSGESLRLLEIQSDKPILLMFYDPDCYHCMQTIGQLTTSNISESVTIVAVYADEDRELWEATANNLPEDWIVGMASDPVQEDETYIFITSPTLYYLSPDKTILLKDTTLSAISAMLKASEEKETSMKE